MKVKVIKFDNYKAPNRAHHNDSGADLFSAEDIVLKPHSVYAVKTGVGVELPDGYDGVIHCKSGLSSKGIWASNAPIDSGYRGEIKIITQNLTSKQKVFRRNDRIAQLLIMPLGDIELYKVDKLSDSDRGTNGFGSTGM